MLDETNMGAEAAPTKVIPREMREVPPARVALVKKQLDEVRKDKQHHAAAHRRIQQDLDFCYKWGIGAMWLNQVEDDERYIANIVQRHITVRQAALYARNPTIVAKPKRRREFRVWDGNMATFQQAMMTSQMAMQSGLPPPPDVTELITDIQEGILRQQMIRNLGETLEIVFGYFMSEQVPDFKKMFKQAVLRALTCGVSWVRLGYQRMYGKKPEIAARLADVTDQLQKLEQLRADMLDDEIGEETAEVEQLRLMLKEMQAEPEIIVREGLIWDFPQTVYIIPDRKTKDLQSLQGCGRLTEWCPMSNDDIKATFGVDVRAAAKNQAERGRSMNDSNALPTNEADPLNVYYVYDRAAGLKYTVCEGYDDFLTEPSAPDVKVERFFPFYPLVFNRIEHPKEIYPASDVRLLRSPQVEYNRKKQGEASHRRANRPLYAVAAGALENEDIKNGDKPSLSNYEDNQILVISGLNEGEEVGKKLQPVPKVPVDPNLYESEGTFNDMQRVVGSQEANLGGTSKSTATESSIAENTRLSSVDSNVDDLDDLLTIIARDGGNVLLLELGGESVTEIVGPGAVWPEFSREEVVKELYLSIEAGSSGRPNQGRDIQNFKEMGPLMMQMPGLNPDYLVKRGWKILDPNYDPNEALMAGMPSITMLNSQKQMGTGDPATDPNAQGGEGGDKNPRPEDGGDGQLAPGATVDFDNQGNPV